MNSEVKVKQDLFINNCMGLIREYKYLLNFTSSTQEAGLLFDEVVKLKYIVNMRNVQLGGKPVFNFSTEEITRLLELADELDGMSIYEIYCTSKYISKQAHKAKSKGRELELGNQVTGELEFA